MTVVVSLVCEDGVVVAADTQVTDGIRGMSYPAQKDAERWRRLEQRALDELF